MFSSTPLQYRHLTHMLPYRSLLCIALVLTPVGCRPKPVPPTTKTQEEHEHFPPHWPKTLETAIERLEKLSKDGDASSETPFHIEVTDLLKWLPELVADTDLDEAFFNQVDSASHDALKSLSEFKDEKAMREEGLNQGDFQTLMKILRTLQNR